MPVAALVVPALRVARRASRQEKTRSFLRKAGHELRTPLNSILGFSEILASELYGPLGASQYKEYAAIIHDSGQRLLKLLDQVLEIARLESGVVELRPQPLPLHACLTEALGELAAEIGARSLQVEVAEGRLPAISADPRGLRTVLCGLISNAVAFSPCGSTVQISARRRSGWVHLSIENRSGAIARDGPRRFLEPFTQGAGDEPPAERGAGLGLPICALTCQAMGGKLTLRTIKGRGLSARVQLPAA